MDTYSGERIGYQKLKYGIIQYSKYGPEGGKLYIRIPGISFNQGINLAIQIIGYNLINFTLEEDRAFFDMTWEVHTAVEVKDSGQGYVELVKLSGD